MKSYTLFRITRKSGNTADYGFGDYSEFAMKPELSLYAKSLRSAQYQFRKFLGPRITFSGKFSPYLVREDKE